MLYADLQSDISNELAFLFLSHIFHLINSTREIIGEGVESIGSFKSFLETGFIREIALLQFNVGTEFEKFF